MPSRAICARRRHLPVPQGKHVEVPGAVIDGETGIYQPEGVAIVNFDPHDIGKTNLLSAQFRKWQRQVALPLVVGIVDGNDITAALSAGPGIGDKAVKCPVVGPSR
jgi:hypothetical protein